MESGKAQTQQETPTVTRSGRRRKASKRLADYEVNMHGVECVQMSFREIDKALTRGELEALVRVDLDPKCVQLAAQSVSNTGVGAARQHGTRLRKAFADVFSEKLTKCPPLREQKFSLELTDAKPRPHRLQYVQSAEGKQALMEMVDETSQAGLTRPHNQWAGELPRSS